MAITMFEGMDLDRSFSGFLPALLFGWKSAFPAGRPPFVATLEHQYGGLACHHVTLSGLLLPLHDNLERARRDPDPLLSAFTELLRDGNDSAPSRFTLLDRCFLTRGDAFDRRVLEEWDALLADYYELPRLKSGFEGWLTFSRRSQPSMVGWRSLVVSTESGSTLVTVDERVMGHLLSMRPDHRSVEPRLHLLWQNSD